MPYTTDGNGNRISYDYSGNYSVIPGDQRSILGDQNASDIASSGDRFDYWLNETETRAQSGDAAALDRLFNYYATQRSEKNALDWTASREDTQYQRLVEDLRKAGISPYILSSATPGVSSYTGQTYSGSQYTTQKNNELNNASSIGAAILRVIGTALMFALFA